MTAADVDEGGSSTEYFPISGVTGIDGNDLIESTGGETVAGNGGNDYSKLLADDVSWDARTLDASDLDFI